MSDLIGDVRKRLQARHDTWTEARKSHQCADSECLHPSHNEALIACRSLEFHAEEDLGALCDKAEALEKERDEWKGHANELDKYVIATEEELAELRLRVEALETELRNLHAIRDSELGTLARTEAALREIKTLTADVDADVPLSHVHGVARTALGKPTP